MSDQPAPNENRLFEVVLAWCESVQQAPENCEPSNVKALRLNAGYSVTERLALMEPGLDRAILRILEFHVGRDNAISTREFRKALADHGFTNYQGGKDFRPVRISMAEIRKGGVIICSTGGKNGGYYLPANRDEAEEYLQVEVYARAMDFLTQLKAMRETVDKTWPDNGQPKLF